MAHPLTGQVQRLRADDIASGNSRELYQRNAPQVEAGLYLVHADRMSAEMMFPVKRYRVMAATLAQLSAGLAAGKYSSVELTRAALARVEQAQPQLNALVTVTAEAALAAGRRGRCRRARPARPGR